VRYNAPACPAADEQHRYRDACIRQTASPERGTDGLSVAGSSALATEPSLAAEVRSLSRNIILWYIGRPIGFDLNEDKEEAYWEHEGWEMFAALALSGNSSGDVDGQRNSLERHPL
jgi:hypothetical protein